MVRDMGSVNFSRRMPRLNTVKQFRIGAIDLRKYSHDICRKHYFKIYENDKSTILT